MLRKLKNNTTRKHTLRQRLKEIKRKKDSRLSQLLLRQRRLGSGSSRASKSKLGNSAAEDTNPFAIGGRSEQEGQKEGVEQQLLLSKPPVVKPAHTTTISFPDLAYLLDQSLKLKRQALDHNKASPTSKSSSAGSSSTSLVSYDERLLAQRSSNSITMADIFSSGDGTIDVPFAEEELNINLSVDMGDIDALTEPLLSSVPNNSNANSDRLNLVNDSANRLLVASGDGSHTSRRERQVSDISCYVNEDGTFEPDDEQHHSLPPGADVSFRDKCCGIRSDRVYLYMLFEIQKLPSSSAAAGGNEYQSSSFVYDTKDLQGKVRMLGNGNEGTFLEKDLNSGKKSQETQKATLKASTQVSLAYVIVNMNDLEIDLIERLNKVGYQAQLRKISSSVFYDISKVVAHISNRTEFADSAAEGICSSSSSSSSSSSNKGKRDNLLQHAHAPASVLVFDEETKEFRNVAVSKGASSLDAKWRSLNVKFSGVQATILLMSLLWESWTCDGFAHEELSNVLLNVALFVQGVNDARAFDLMAHSREDWMKKLGIFLFSTTAHGFRGRLYVIGSAVSSALFCLMLAMNLGSRAWKNLEFNTIQPKYMSKHNILALPVASICATTFGLFIPYLGFANPTSLERRTIQEGWIVLEDTIFSFLIIGLSLLFAKLNFVQDILFPKGSHNHCSLATTLNYVEGIWFITSMILSIFVIYWVWFRTTICHRTTSSTNASSSANAISRRLKRRGKSTFHSGDGVPLGTLLAGINDVIVIDPALRSSRYLRFSNPIMNVVPLGLTMALGIFLGIQIMQWEYAK